MLNVEGLRDTANKLDDEHSRKVDKIKNWRIVGGQPGLTLGRSVLSRVPASSAVRTSPERKRSNKD